MLSQEVDNVLTQAILDSFYEVYNTLGYGYLEKVYQNALKRELESRGLQVEAEKAIKVNYKGSIVGDYFADLYVNNEVLVELKVCEKITQAHEAQLVNYLVATKVKVGLILNFGPSPQQRRKLNT